MRNFVGIECQPELLIGLNTKADQFAERVKREAAYKLEKVPIEFYRCLLVASKSSSIFLPVLTKLQSYVPAKQR